MTRKRCITVFLLLIFMMGMAFCMNLCIGSAEISFSEAIHILFFGKREDTASAVLLSIRLPRTLAALLLGGALALSGYLLQTFFHNPIAGPFVLGVSAGAKLTVAFTMIAAAGSQLVVSAAGMIGAAFVGSMLSLSLVLWISHRVNRMSMLVVCGVMIGYICSAITDLAVTFADDSNIVNLHNWSMGSFSGTSMLQVRDMALVTLAAFCGVLFLSKPIGAYQLGESYAKSLGVPVRTVRIALILLSGLLAACVTAFAGPISFVGIAVPHLIRRAFRTAKPIVLIPACILGGSIFCLICDLIARTAFAPTELRISTVTAIFGAPVVMAVLIRKRKGEAL